MSTAFKDGLRMDIKVTTDDTMHFNMGSDWCVQIGEGMARFTVNGIDGWGVCQTLRRLVVVANKRLRNAKWQHTLLGKIIGCVRLASQGRPRCVAFSFSRTNVCR